MRNICGIIGPAGSLALVAAALAQEADFLTGMVLDVNQLPFGGSGVNGGFVKPLFGKRRLLCQSKR